MPSLMINLALTQYIPSQFDFFFDFFDTFFFIFFGLVIFIIVVGFIGAIIASFRARKNIGSIIQRGADLNQKLIYKEKVLVICPYCGCRNPEQNKICEKCAAPL